MADGSAQNSAELSENNIRSDPSPNKQRWKTPVIGTVTIITIIYNIVFIAIVFGYKVSPYSKTFYGLAGSSIGSICTSLLAILYIYPEWYRQAGFNMCAAALYVCFLNVPGFAMYYTAKKIMQFEKINNLFLYAVCFVDFVLFVFISLNPIARERFRLLVINIGNGIGNGVNGIGNGVNGIGNGVNGIGNGIRNVVNLAFGTNRGDEVPQNEEIELQPLAEQSGEV
ncbi:uncharacterized protein SOCG_04789 [Schizosaccharomyces octosporus yFS286]|uniref:Uncharacterized protein n=1 Tax=Schizosaccharomyces octosporus (strain yFS286) TaxID=483514 RepID=S9PMC3_SCHOY|nr:uncharacterized protein SOCG_04789 [Schizosaccharomyces octosporus yFS286]EPX70416.1 hypothetical protein SOCG_04789 [Schizosaccharomyces octosporus yFS286]